MRQLMLLTCILTLCGCSSKVGILFNWSGPRETAASIETTIEDPDKRAALQSLVSAYTNDVQIIEEKALALQKQLNEAGRQYDTTREELESIYAELAVLLQQYGDTARHYSLEARQYCTEEEWYKITSHRTAPISAAL